MMLLSHNAGRRESHPLHPSTCSSNHTTGLSYPWNSPSLTRWRQEHSKPELLSGGVDIDAFVQPLDYEPGTRWRYSTGLDWAGILISRVTGKSLEEVFQENIFTPCGIKDMTFYPRQDIKDRMMGMCTRGEDGKVIRSYSPPMNREMDPEKVGAVFSGGGGLFGTARDYLTFLRHILASQDPSSTSIKPLLSQSSFQLLFTDVLPQTSEIKADLAATAKEQNVYDPSVLTNGTGELLGHSPGLFLTKADSKFGRKAGSGCWDGAAKTQYWIDPTTGIAVSRCCMR
jgi:methyl acetate hydrolase